MAGRELKNQSECELEAVSLDVGILARGKHKTMNDFFSMIEKLQGMFDSEDVEIVTNDGQRYRGKIDNLRSTMPFSKPAVKIKGSDGKIVKILFTDIKDMIDHRESNNA